MLPCEVLAVTVIVVFLPLSGTNAEIQFELMAPTPSGTLFRVDAVTGLVITNMEIDETHSDRCYNLTVLAKDQGVPQNTDTATVLICITDQNQSPQFDQAFYAFNISENLPAGTSTRICTQVKPVSLAMFVPCRHSCWNGDGS